ncbi:MAG: hypothetical protein IJ298_09710 [Ruminococcus sp.]|nr:hypothetical protein [Ruminococcus sp.]
MITDKLTIYGDKENKECISALVERCAQVLGAESFSTQVYTEPLSEDISFDKDAQCVVVEYNDKDKVPERVRCVTYSFSDNRSDVMALNLQHREYSDCFELLHKVFMSRIFIPHTSGYTPKQALICAAILLSSGVSAERIVETINEILK